MKYFNNILISLLFTASSFCGLAQSTILKSANSNIVNKIKEIEKTIEVEKDEMVLAQKYEELAGELLKIDSYHRAEKYFKKALIIYENENEIDKVATIYRKLARLYERQSDLEAAIKNYELSNKISQSHNINTLNTNDIQRIGNINNPEVQQAYADSNAFIHEEQGEKDDISEAYLMNAQQQLKNENSAAAIGNYKKALESSSENIDKSLAITSDLAIAFEQQQQYDEALFKLGNAMEKAINSKNYIREISIKKSMASLYFKKNEIDTAFYLLEEAYQLALEKGKTFMGKEIIYKISDFYEENKQLDAALSAHKRFQIDLEQFISKDSSLVDAKIFEVTEQKIKKLEEEKGEQEKVIEQTSRFNYILLFSIIFLIILLVLILRVIFIIRKRNQKIALESLRREMNPHFIFNSLNSINRFIAENNELGANQYLTAYSRLMRNTMENSGKDFISLSDEMELIEKYLNLEQLRFQNTFDYQIQVDDTLNDSLLIPNMLAQPHLENAIWHGLRYLEEKGKLKVVFRDMKKSLEIIIEDNGIGREASKRLKTENQQKQKSRGIKNVEERVQLLNRLYHTGIQINIIDLPKNGGTRVVITFKKNDKQKV